MDRAFYFFTHYIKPPFLFVVFVYCTCIIFHFPLVTENAHIAYGKDRTAKDNKKIPQKHLRAFSFTPLFGTSPLCSWILSIFSPFDYTIPQNKDDVKTDFDNFQLSCEKRPNAENAPHTGRIFALRLLYFIAFCARP